jgi:DHA1 family bicyclomycin/chloramphenicol resistance-like MFS transporter
MSTDAPSQRRIIFFIILVMMLTAFAIDEYAASLPHMARALHTGGGNMQLSITVFLLVLAVFQVIFGALWNYQGRRRLLLACIGIFLAGTIICIFSKSYQYLLLGRIIQGMGCALPNIYGPTVIGEAVIEEDIPKVTSYFVLGYSLIPIISPFIGGYLQEYFNWQANFWFLFAVGLAIFIPSMLWLPETLKKESIKPFSFQDMLHQYKEVLCNVEFVTACVSSFFIWAPVIVFSVIAPFLLQNTLGVSASTYGELALVVGAGFFIGNMLNAFVVKHNYMSQKMIATIAFILWIAMAALQLGIMLSGELSIRIVIWPVFMMMVGMSFAFPVVYAIAISATELPGVAGSLINTIILLLVALLTAIISAYHIHSGTIFSAIFLGCALAAVVTYILSNAYTRHK